ncbi:hypothetical protein KY285_001523 [Solanum tuberosum]|nr:hypothetical protein KY285_001523 [Solanum tuberosum]
MVVLAVSQPPAGDKTPPQHIQNTIDSTHKPTYVAKLQANSSTRPISKTELKPIKFIHGEPTIEFTMDEVNEFSIEDGLHQAVILKFSYGKPNLHELRKILPKQLDIKGHCNIGQLEFRHLLIRFDLYEDSVQVLSINSGFIKSNSEEFLFRTFLWTIWFNPKEETSKALTWISFPDLPPNLFAKKPLLSIASVVEKPVDVDKVTQECTRPCTTRVKVILDLLDTHPKKIKLFFVDKDSSKVIEHYQEFVYDNLPRAKATKKNNDSWSLGCTVDRAVENSSEEATTFNSNNEENLENKGKSIEAARRGVGKDGVLG